MPKLDLDAIPQVCRTNYPQPYAADMGKRHVRRLGPPSGLTDFGVSHVMLEPGGLSSQRHWHEHEDEFLIMLDGEAVLVEDEGEITLRPGDCASFPKGVPNGHHLVNRSGRPCSFMVIGKSTNDTCHYSDIDLRFDGPSQSYTHKDGSPYAGAVS